jgi:hypothetical protein
MSLAAKNYLDYPGLSDYDTLIKNYIGSVQIKSALQSGYYINFYQEENPDPTQDTPVISINLANNQINTDHAGGTAVTLNGTSASAGSASFYAPVTAGTSGQVLRSNGSGAPTWGEETLPTVSNGVLCF